MANTSSTALVIHHSNHTHGHQPPPDVVVDALPYYDSGYEEPGVREAVSSQSSSRFRCCYSIFAGSWLNRRRNTSLQADEKLSGTTGTTVIPFIRGNKHFHFIFSINRSSLDGNHEERIRTSIQSSAYGNVEHETVKILQVCFSI